MHKHAYLKEQNFLSVKYLMQVVDTQEENRLFEIQGLWSRK